MIGRRTAVGLTLLCALILSAVMASSASAVIAGTTAFTCVKEPNPTKTTKGFLDEHCTKAETGVNVKFVHVPIKQDELTIFHGTNAHTSADTVNAEPAIFSSTISKTTKVLITCKKVFAHGKLTNKFIEPSKEHFVHGQEVTIKYTECKFEEPSTCVVEKEEILLEKVTATTEKEGDNVRFKPELGTTLGTILVKCFGITKIPIEGTVRAQSSGATLTFSEAGTTAEKTLTLLKEPAGLEGKITVSQADETQEAGKTGNPIALTTVET